MATAFHSTQLLLQVFILVLIFSICNQEIKKTKIIIILTSVYLAFHQSSDYLPATINTPKAGLIWPFTSAKN